MLTCCVEFNDVLLGRQENGDRIFDMVSIYKWLGPPRLGVGSVLKV